MTGIDDAFSQSRREHRQSRRGWLSYQSWLFYYSWPGVSGVGGASL